MLTCGCCLHISVVDGFVRQIVDTERDGVSDVFIGDIVGQLDGHADVSCVSVGCLLAGCVLASLMSCGAGRMSHPSGRVQVASQRRL